MRLTATDCWRRLATEHHGVFGTVNATRGIDAVPVVFAITGQRIVIPIDTVKPKRSGQLQRVANLEADSRCVLLVDHYEDDWAALWWVRVHGRATVAAGVPDDAARALIARYPSYEAAGSIAGVIVVQPVEVVGWSAC